MDVNLMDKRSKEIISQMFDIIEDFSRKASMNMFEYNPEEPLIKNIRLILIVLCEIIHELDIYEELKENPITNNALRTLKDFMEQKNE